MKNRLLGIICVFLFFASSCKKDKNDETIEVLSVVGVWGIVDGAE